MAFQHSVAQRLGAQHLRVAASSEKLKSYYADESFCVRGCMLVLLQGKCYDGTCQASDKLFEVKSISPSGTIPANNTEWIWLRLYTAGSAIGEVSTLASQDGLATPAAVNASIVATAPEDPRTPGSAIGTALKMVNPLSTDRTEAAVWYRNNTPAHPPGLFNGMKVRPLSGASCGSKC